MTPLTVAEPAEPVLAGLLRAHPRVSLAGNSTGDGIEFSQGKWQRRIRVGSLDEPLKGLLELMDNNPLVCADSASVPSPLATLGLIALGPLFLAGLLVEAPLLQSNAPVSECGPYWKTAGFDGDVQIEAEPFDTGTVYAAQAMAVVKTPADWSEIDALYHECFGRSFYVWSHETGDWDAKIVANTPKAVYRLRFTPDEPTSLLTIQVMADKDGKCGAAQVVHALNVMAGFEESLGIPDTLLRV